MQIINIFAQTRIVHFSLALMAKYNLQPVNSGMDLQPFTFFFTDQCLDMMVQDDMEISPEDISPQAQKIQAEKKWAELELRLLFFPVESGQIWQ